MVEEYPLSYVSCSYQQSYSVFFFVEAGGGILEDWVEHLGGVSSCNESVQELLCDFDVIEPSAILFPIPFQESKDVSQAGTELTFIYILY